MPSFAFAEFNFYFPIKKPRYPYIAQPVLCSYFPANGWNHLNMLKYSDFLYYFLIIKARDDGC